MTLIITVTHVLVSLALIFVVLLQKGSGADMGAAFGGSSQSVFGARGSGSFLGKMTAGLATVFMLTSLSLAFFTTQKGANVSVMEEMPVATGTQVKPVKLNDPSVPASMPPKDVVRPAGPVGSVAPEAVRPIPALPDAGKGQESAIPSVLKSSPSVQDTAQPSEPAQRVAPEAIRSIPALPEAGEGQENVIPSMPKSSLSAPPAEPARRVIPEAIEPIPALPETEVGRDNAVPVVLHPSQ